MPPEFADRAAAGRRLAARLTRYQGRDDVVVLALPRGGVPVGYQVARALGAPLDVLAVAKLGAPDQPELALGAVAADGTMVINADIVAGLGVSEAALSAAAAHRAAEIEKRCLRWRGPAPPLPVEGRTVIVVDDGLATGATMRAGLSAVRKQHPAAVIGAVPVGPPDACTAMASVADDVICAFTPTRPAAVGQWYQEFSQLSDGDVHRLLEQARTLPASCLPQTRSI